MNNVHIYKDNVDTDVIIPARYLNSSDPEHLAKYCMEDIDQEFSDRVEVGDFIVAGENFGCGSSREHAPISIKACGVKAVIAKSFARIYFRNSVNIGLPAIICPEAATAIENNDKISVDLEKGVITNTSKEETYEFQKYPEFMLKIFDEGGLVNYAKKYW
jgi:3-isopropylmalate/(R)-2-methylmalate dehydratase small subunit